MQGGYFKAAWSDIKNSPGWFSKLLCLGLVSFIPVFGQIVVMGYLYGWARDIAWGAKTPLPSRIFGNEDGKLYSRGFFVLVIVFVFSLVPSVINMVGSLLGSVAPIAFYGSGANRWMLGLSMVVLSMLISVVSLVASFFASWFSWVGSMRMSLYGRLSAGFQIGKIWRMMRHDFGGILRIFGMNLILGLVIAAIVFFAMCVAGVVCGIFGFAVFGDAGMHARFGSGAPIGAIAGFGIGALLLIIVLTYAALVMISFAYAMCTRAMGYWVRQFDVPHWQGQDDPMPFEVASFAQPQPQSSTSCPQPPEQG